MCVFVTMWSDFRTNISFQNSSKPICARINPLDTVPQLPILLTATPREYPVPLRPFSSPPPLLLITVPFIHLFIYSQPDPGHQWTHSSLCVCLSHTPIPGLIRRPHTPSSHLVSGNWRWDGFGGVCLQPCKLRLSKLHCSLHYSTNQIRRKGACYVNLPCKLPRPRGKPLQNAPWRREANGLVRASVGPCFVVSNRPVLHTPASDMDIMSICILPGRAAIGKTAV